MSWLLGLIPGVGPFAFLAKNWKLIAGMIAAAIFALFVWSWDSRGKEAAILGQQNAVLQADIRVLKKAEDMRREADLAAAARVAEAGQHTTRTNKISEEAYRAQSSQDAPVAPVLRGTLNALRQLQQPAGGGRKDHSGSRP